MNIHLYIHASIYFISVKLSNAAITYLPPAMLLARPKAASAMDRPLPPWMLLASPAVLSAMLFPAPPLASPPLCFPCVP